MHEQPHVLTLGTAGGPRWWGATPTGVIRCGISTAVVVEGKSYIVDFGRGAATQFQKAGLDIDDVEATFLTHLHSDHTVDLIGFMLFGWMMTDKRTKPIPIYGPGDRGVLPLVSPAAKKQVEQIFDDLPTAGTEDMVSLLLKSHSTDITDRMHDLLMPTPYSLWEPNDIEIPAGIGYHPNMNVSPAGMEPFTVFEDDRVRVTATLVEHPPLAPAFGFRFDTEVGSVTISGDTAPCENLVRLAEGTDLLLHEAIDLDGMKEMYEKSPGGESMDASMQHHYQAHTTPADAAKIATLAGAKKLALHHLVPGTVGDHIAAAAEEHFPSGILIPDDGEKIYFGNVESQSILRSESAAYSVL
ncbi:MBL fold metallo-hydrolase [Corynebacterium sp. A21]|uniref:MBL fold metallo-hydrolase n=1 Tax=Corynebacterium sp. A21 TaxID=3457318 RepID=UPI003FD6B6CB